MEDHHHYGMADLRQFMNTRPHFPPIPHHSDLFPAHHHHRTLTPAQPYDLMMVGRQVTHDMMSRGLHDFVTDSAAPPPTTTATNTNTVVPTSNATLTGLDADAACLGGDASTGRWPRQETLTLLEIRSRLDSKFKEANQKGPLWDEVSRIMSEEHGYQRSGKKCREKFENLYKYYKKTKEGKAGRQDGKHYRFFRQLEALYGDTSNAVSVPENHLAGSSLTFHTATNLNIATQNQEIFQTPKLCDSLSLSNSSDFDTSSSEDDDHNNTGPTENGSTDKKNRRSRRSWKVKIKDFIDSQMRKLMEKQEAWLEKMLKALEHKEQERILREEEWRKQEAARLDREHKFWATQRAWIEARDAALMDTLQKLTGRELKVPSPEELMATQHRNPGERQNENGSETVSNSVKGESWPESEITRLMQLRTNMESRFQQAGSSEEVLWEDIAGKMACLGYDRSAIMCKDKWNSINNYLLRTKECNKKRKENSRSCTYFLSNETLYNQGGAYCEISEPGPEMARLQPNEGSPPSNSNAGSAVPDSCFRFLMADGNLWENYALKLNKGDNQ